MIFMMINLSIKKEHEGPRIGQTETDEDHLPEKIRDKEAQDQLQRETGRQTETEEDDRQSEKEPEEDGKEGSCLQ